MAIELPKDARCEAIASIERCLAEHLDPRIGNIAAGGLLGFFLEETGPSTYNKAMADAPRYTAGRSAHPFLNPCPPSPHPNPPR